MSGKRREMKEFVLSIRPTMAKSFNGIIPETIPAIQGQTSIADALQFRF
jgi:hypothetical protein